MASQEEGINVLIACTEFNETNGLMRHTDIIFNGLSKYTNNRKTNITVINGPRSSIIGPDRIRNKKITIPEGAIEHLKRVGQQYNLDFDIDEEHSVYSLIVEHLRIRPQYYDIIVFIGCNQLDWICRIYYDDIHYDEDPKYLEEISRLIKPSTKLMFTEYDKSVDRKYKYNSSVRRMDGELGEYYKEFERIFEPVTNDRSGIPYFKVKSDGKNDNFEKKYLKYKAKYVMLKRKLSLYNE